MTGDHHSVSAPLPPLVTVSAVGDGSLSVTDDNDIIVFGRPEGQHQKEAPQESSGKPVLSAERVILQAFYCPLRTVITALDGQQSGPSFKSTYCCVKIVGYFKCSRSACVFCACPVF